MATSDLHPEGLLSWHVGYVSAAAAVGAAAVTQTAQYSQGRQQCWSLLQSLTQTGYPLIVWRRCLFNFLPLGIAALLCSDIITAAGSRFEQGIPVSMVVVVHDSWWSSEAYIKARFSKPFMAAADSLPYFTQKTLGPFPAVLCYRSNVDPGKGLQLLNVEHNRALQPYLGKYCTVVQELVSCLLANRGLDHSTSQGHLQRLARCDTA